MLGGSKAASTPTAPSDPLKRETPRGSIHNFLEACHANNFALAAQYLDLSGFSPSQRASRGPELAKELGELLDSNPRFEVNDLSNDEQGDVTDGLAPSTDTLATFELNDAPVTLQMNRVNQQGLEVWLVSAASVERIPALSKSLSGHPGIEAKLPAPLVKIKFIDTPLWVWIVLVLAALILSVVSGRLSALFLLVMRPVAKRYAPDLQKARRFEALTEPLRLILSVVVFRAVMGFLAPSALLREYLLKLMALLFVLGTAALAMRILDVISDHIISRLDHRERALSYSVFPLALRLIKIVMFIIAVLITLSAWGYNTTTILAGVGVGGLAIALAAQKTLENLFGGFSVISDRPVLVGDFCQFGTQVGTIEDIGLRSTRIRTLDRTVVTIPNAQFSTMTLENFSKRDKMWFHPALQLRPETSPSQVQQMMDAITGILEKHPMVDASGVPLRFTQITPNSLRIEIFAYVLTPDFNQFLVVQSELLLKILQAAAEHNIGFAVPFAESINIPIEMAVKAGEHPPFLEPASPSSEQSAAGKSPVPAGRETDGTAQKS